MAAVMHRRADEPTTGRSGHLLAPGTLTPASSLLADLRARPSLVSWPQRCRPLGTVRRLRAVAGRSASAAPGTPARTTPARPATGPQPGHCHNPPLKSGSRTRPGGHPGSAINPRSKIRARSADNDGGLQLCVGGVIAAASASSMEDALDSGRVFWPSLGRQALGVGRTMGLPE
jgi:hypothetical protein